MDRDARQPPLPDPGCSDSGLGGSEGSARVIGPRPLAEPSNEPRERQLARTVTSLLDDIRAGKAGSHDALFEVMYAELRRVGQSIVNANGIGRDLSGTALVNEAYVRLFGRDLLLPANRLQFFKAFSLAMRRCAIDYRRRMNRGGVNALADHGGDVDAFQASAALSYDLLDVDRALEQLVESDERAGNVALLKLFGGRTLAEIASLYELPPKKIEDDWTYAKAFLRRALAAYRPPTPNES